MDCYRMEGCMAKKTIGFVGPDARTCMCAYTVSTVENDRYTGAIIKGMSGMGPVLDAVRGKKDWSVKILAVEGKTVEDYKTVIIRAFEDGEVDYIVIMPEDLLYQGLVNELIEAGYGDRVIGLEKDAAFIEGDKIKAKTWMKSAGVPVAPFEVADARDLQQVKNRVTLFIRENGGAVLKYPYSAGGKGSRAVFRVEDILDVWNKLIKDYTPNYQSLHGDGEWPLLIEAWKSEIEISFTTLVDGNGNFQTLPTAMDYTLRYEGPPSQYNPVTGGMAAIGMHPAETPELIKIVGDKVFKPFIKEMKKNGVLRPCILYPGCRVSLDPVTGKPVDILVYEMNIRAGEPEMQVVARRLKNLGELIEATIQGRLDEVKPKVRKDQISICVALVTGPGGPQGQKGYPDSYTRFETVVINYKSLGKRGILVVPSNVSWDNEKQRLVSDGSRVFYLVKNATIKPGQKRGNVAETLRNTLLQAFDNGVVRVIPREAEETFDAAKMLFEQGNMPKAKFEKATATFEKANRLDLRRDPGRIYEEWDELFPNWQLAQ
jgi:phosphoribosylamine---glycine ligase